MYTPPSVSSVAARVAITPWCELNRRDRPQGQATGWREGPCRPEAPLRQMASEEALCALAVYDHRALQRDLSPPLGMQGLVKYPAGVRPVVVRGTAAPEGARNRLVEQ